MVACGPVSAAAPWERAWEGRRPAQGCAPRSTGGEGHGGSQEHRAGRQAPAARGWQREVVLTTGGKLLKEEREVRRAGATP